MSSNNSLPTLGSLLLDLRFNGADTGLPRTYLRVSRKTINRASAKLPSIVNPHSTMASPIEASPDRIPRPQRVLTPGRISVPTASALLKEQLRTRTPAIRRSVPLRSPATTGTASHSPSDALTSGSSSAIDTEYDVESAENESLQRSAVQTLGPMITLGTFTQDQTKWTIRAQRGRKGLVMVKRLDRGMGEAEISFLRRISHRNIAKFVHSYMEDGRHCIAIEYCRFTVAEILHVHLRLEEPQLQLIARSVSLTILSIFSV